MAVRAALLLPVCLFTLAPVFAQDAPAAPAPAPEVDQALRARVTEFFQDFVEGKYRQALSLVADDTQDLYFASSKQKIESFSIQSVEYTPDFNKAAVTLKVKRIMSMRAEGFFKEIPVEAPMTVEWKLENGKWVWTQRGDVPATPMGGKLSAAAAGSAKIPDKIDDSKARSEASRILGDSSTHLEGNTVTLDLDHRSSAKLVFHNGRDGSVDLGVVGFLSGLPGLTAHVDSSTVNAGKDASIEFIYDPAAKPLVTPPPSSVQLEVIVDPFAQAFPVLVKLQSSN